MRLVHVVPTYLPATRYGGPIHSVHGLCRALVRLGHEVHVATTNVDGDGDSEVPLEQAVSLDGVQVWYHRSRALRRLYLARTMQAQLRATIGSFDLLHVHSVFLWPTSMAARAAHAAAVPYVVSPRGMLVRELIARRNGAVKRSWLTLIESTTLAQASAIHFTSERERLDARELPLPLPSPFVLGNGVDAPLPGFEDRASPRARALIVRGEYALYLGRLSWKKGLDRALQALQGSDVKLLLCGPDDEGYRPKLEQLAHQLGVQGQVRFELPIDGEDKWAVLRAARFVVLPSHNENFGNVVLEAMAAGRPTIVTEGVGAAPLVQSAGAGIVTEASAQALGQAMRALWSDRARAEQLGQAASIAAAPFSWTEIARAMGLEYERIIARGRI